MATVAFTCYACFFMSLLVPLENSFCVPCGPWEVSVMMPCCPNTTSGGCTGSLDYSGWSGVCHFHPRGWFRDGRVLQTRPICWYPGTDPEPWKREVFWGWLNLLLLILHLSLHPLSLLCNFAVPPIKMQNVFTRPFPLDLVKRLFGQGDISKLAHLYLCFCLEKSFLRVAFASSSLSGEEAHMGQSYSGCLSLKQSLLTVSLQIDKK